MECDFGKRHKFIIDEDEVNTYKNYCFVLHKDGYVQVSSRKEGKKGKLLHRLIMNVEDPKVQVDHINGNGLDNRKSNLRLCCNSQNQMNKGKTKLNTTGFKGVCFHKLTQKYQATVSLNKKQIYLGLFDTAEEAHQAYCKRATELHKEFANFGQ